MDTATVLVNATEMGRRVGVTSSTIRRWAQDGIIPTVWLSERTRRYDPDEVIAALKKHGETAARSDT